MDETNNVFFVDFYKYCKRCVHESMAEELEPCNSCLAIAARPGTRKPDRYKPTDKYKEDK